MNRYLMRLSYDGTDFSGWQTQPDVRTVQKTIETAFFKITDNYIPIIGSGRTDAGVHAINQYAHFDLDTKLTLQQLTKALNSNLPEDIFIKDIKLVEADFSARYNALKRTYQYTISKVYDPILRNYKSFLPKYRIDPEIIAASLNFFLGKKDFTSFSKHNPDLKHKTCNLLELSFREKDQDLIFQITANRFLHNMVRRIIGTLISVSHFKQDPEIILELLEAKDPVNKLIFTAPAQGLYLKQVTYDT